MQKAEQKPIVTVVNDDPSQLMILSSILERGGMEARPFTSVSKALAGMANKPEPALIITDLQMPEVDGWRFCRLLRSPEYAAFNNTPILSVSAIYEGDESARLSIEAGADDFLAMPVNAETLFNTALGLIGSSRRCPKHRALIVEDAKITANVIRKCLEHGGYDVRDAKSISEARKAFGETEFDIVIIDYHLPDGRGDSLLDEFGARQSRCVRIMMTGDATPELALAWMRRGASAYVRKPFQPDYLLSICARSMRELAFLRDKDNLAERIKAFRQEQEKHLILINNTPDFIYSLDLDGRHTAVNRSVCDAMKLAPDEIIGKNHAELGFPEDIAREWRALHAKVFSGRRPVTVETSVVMPDGIAHVYEARLFPILSDQGLSQGLSGVSHDITARKRAEEKLRESEKKYHELIKIERRRISADLHDTICQQLAGIGFICKRIVQDAGASAPEIQDMAREISGVATDCSNAVRSIAQMLKPLPDEPGALQSALRDLSLFIGRVFGKQCVCRLNDAVSFSVPDVVGDLLLLAREAALNAAKHSTGNTIEIDLWQNDGETTIIVSDNGTGADLLPGGTDPGRGMGIMKMRAERIGARLDIGRKQDGGVAVMCKWRDPAGAQASPSRNP